MLVLGKIPRLVALADGPLQAAAQCFIGTGQKRRLSLSCGARRVGIGELECAAPHWPALKLNTIRLAIIEIGTLMVRNRRGIRLFFSGACLLAGALPHPAGPAQFGQTLFGNQTKNRFTYEISAELN